MFPAAIPHRPWIRFHWAIAPEPETLRALQTLAGDTAYVGHSASVVRCRFELHAAIEPNGNRVTATRRVYPGSLASLRQSYERGERPLPGESIVEIAATPQDQTPASVFGDQWIVLEDAG